MVNEDIVDSTIRRMLDAEIDEPTIISTLNDVGLDDASARDRIEKVKNSLLEEVTPQPKIVSQSEQDDENDSSLTTTSVEEDSDAQELNEITNQNDRDFKERELKEINEEIKDLKQVSSKKMSVVEEQIDSNSITDLKAQNNALMRVMKDILEVNRKILVELESKK